MAKQIEKGFGSAEFPDMGFRTVVDQIIAERADADTMPKTMTLIVTVEATREVISQFSAVAKSARGELTEMGVALHDLAHYARGGKVQLARTTFAYQAVDFDPTLPS